MTTIFKLSWLSLIVILLLAACGGGSTPTLAVSGQPTLVFVYTDG